MLLDSVVVSGIFTHIRLFQIKRDWFCRLYYQDSYLETRKSNFFLYVKKFTIFCSFVFFTKTVIFYKFWRCFDEVEKSRHEKKNKIVIKHVKTYFIQKLLFFQFFYKIFSWRYWKQPIIFMKNNSSLKC